MSPVEHSDTFLDALPVALVEVAADGSIGRANAEACRLLGYSYDALTKRYTSDFDLETFHEDGRPCRFQEYPVSIAMSTGQVATPLTLRVVRPDGHMFWGIFGATPRLDDGGHVTSAMVTVLDITRQKEVEAKLRSVLSSAPDHIIMCDLEGRILFINHVNPPHRFETIVGQLIYSFAREDDHATMRATLARVLATREVHGYESMLTPALGPRVYSAQVGPVLAGSEVVGFTIVTRELTEHRQLQLRLSIADRMAAVGQLAAGVAHEVNNPLTYVMANVARMQRVLENDDSLGPMWSESMSAALEGLARIRVVVRDLTNLGRGLSDERALVDVSTVIDSALRMSQVEALSHARIVRDYGDAPALWASEARLGQVFSNLVLNATRAMAERPAPLHVLRLTTATDETGMCLVEVSDTGVGVAPEHVARIFDAHFTTKPAGQGMGLGLSICKDIVVGLGGTITVESELGRGTTFRVRLPPADVSRATVVSKADATTRAHA